MPAVARGLAGYLEIAEDLNAPLEPEEWGRKRSPYTGRQLRTLRARTGTRDQALHERFIDALSAEGRSGFPLHLKGEEQARPWSARLVSSSRTSTNGGEAQYSYVLELEEMEDYEVERIRIAGVEMEPLQYQERVSGESLCIDLLVQSGEAEESRLFELWQEPGAYFEVERLGVDEVPREMRLGMLFWSEHPEGRKFRFTLVDRSYDADGTRHWAITLETPNESARRRLALLEGVVEELLGELAQQGVLSGAAKEQLVERARNGVAERRFEFYRVADAADRM